MKCEDITLAGSLLNLSTPPPRLQLASTSSCPRRPRSHCSTDSCQCRLYLPLFNPCSAVRRCPCIHTRSPRPLEPRLACLAVCKACHCRRRAMIADRRAANSIRRVDAASAITSTPSIINLQSPSARRSKRTRGPVCRTLSPCRLCAQTRVRLRHPLLLCSRPPSAPIDRCHPLTSRILRIAVACSRCASEADQIMELENIPFTSQLVRRDA